VHKPTVLLLAAVAAVGGFFFFQGYRVEGLGDIRLVRRDGASSSRNLPLDTPPPVTRIGDTIRIASFNIQVFGTTKADKPVVMEILARVVRQFDVVAVQEIRSKDQDIVPRLVEKINATGRSYDYVIGPRLGRTHSKEQYAFIFDRASIAVDRGQLYTIEDLDDLLHREPLVGSFRVRGPPEADAFTFTLVNVHVDPDETDQELNVLDDVFRAVRDDGRHEDDVILLGDLNVGDDKLGELGTISNLVCAISGTPTNTRGNEQYDNIVFQHTATREFVGRSGVFDFMRQYNLTLAEALEVSDHLPVWAEFSVHEGGQPGRVAARPEQPVR
jgi:endonuclease/exonuclease/phosphatase family metal-dependent hydrolase